MMCTPSSLRSSDANTSLTSPDTSPMICPRLVVPVARAADAVGDALLPAALLGLAHRGDLGDRVDAIGSSVETRDLYSRSKAWHMATRACSIEVEASAGKPITSPAA